MHHVQKSGFLGLNKLAALFMAVALIWLGCESGLHSGRISQSSVQRFDGRTVYKGIFLASGPVADKIPEISDNLRLEEYIPDESKRADLFATYDRVFDKMEEIQPGFFDHFADVMQRGNHFAIEAELRSATDLTWKAFRRIPEFQTAIELLKNDPSVARAAVDAYQRVNPSQQLPKSEIDKAIQSFSENSDSLEAACVVFVWAFAVYVVAAVDAAVVSNVAAVVALAVAVAVVVPVAVTVTVISDPLPIIETQGRALSSQQLIDSIAANLGAQ